MRNKYLLFILAAVAFLIFTTSFGLASLYTDWLWFSVLGYQSVFLTILLSEMGLRIAVGVLFFAFILFNLLFTRQFILKKVHEFKSRPRPAFDENVIEMRPPLEQFEQWIKLITKRALLIVFLVVSAVLAFMTSGAFSGDWIILQKFLNGVYFGITDPIFAKDIGFYVFQLPFYQFILAFLSWSIIVTALAVGVLYTVSEALTNNGQIKLLKSTQSRLHLSVLAAVFFIVKAVDFYLSQFDLLFNSTGVVHGAGYTDVHVTLLALKVLAALSVLTAGIILVNIFLRRFNWVMYSVVGLLVTAIILNGLAPAFVERFIVVPNQFNMEKPYITHNIEFTRKAYNLDEIETAAFPARVELTAQDIQENRATIDNIRVWDSIPLKQTYAQLQEMRLYYDFVDIDIDRYIIDGQLRQVMLAAREMNIDNFAPQAQTWVNQRLIYTHGFGVAMSPVNEATAVGLPKFFIKDIPPVGVEEIPVDRPEIYFGEITNQHVFVNTHTDEFNFPLGDENVFTQHTANVGIELGGFFNRAILAYALSDYRLMLSDDIHAESRVLLHRNIHERVPKIAPFLMYDNDPYIVVHEGGLYWIWDAYTTTNMFPYSEPFLGDLNYIRNSVKVVISAYSGEVNFYISDPEDPLIQSFSKIFPALFKDLDEMPTGLQAHIRYPIDLFNIQAQMFTDYHMRDPLKFYNKEDRWELPTEIFMEDTVRMGSFYTVLELPDGTGPEFVQIIPFTPVGRDNMVAWMVGRSDGEHYGRLFVYKFPAGELVFGPMQVEARINQDGYISEQITLWDAAGSSVTRGNLLVIPVNDGIIYVEPLYLQADAGGLPELRRVIVSHGDAVVMEPTLDKALQRLFGGQVGVADDIALPGEEIEELDQQEVLAISELIRRAVQLHDEAQSRLREGDWAGFGDAQNRLERVLDQLDQQAE
ncbi:UPF0182 family protein [Peptococcaceae bacterium]|nr:UPF0182 family protein [Peptococcaceae bacterium]